MLQVDYHQGNLPITNGRLEVSVAIAAVHTQLLFYVLFRNTLGLVVKMTARLRTNFESRSKT